MTSVIFTYPLDVIRVRLAISTDKPQFRGVVHATVSIFKNEGGVRALYRGLTPTLWV